MDRSARFTQDEPESVGPETEGPSSTSSGVPGAAANMNIAGIISPLSSNASLNADEAGEAQDKEDFVEQKRRVEEEEEKKAEIPHRRKLSSSSSCSASHDVDATQIAKDLHRTGLPLPADKHGLLSDFIQDFLRSSSVGRSWGYSQTLAPVAGAILMVCDYDTTLSGTLLEILVSRILPEGYWDKSLSGLATEQAVLRWLLPHAMPSVFR
jgi:hypothetical protein